MDLIICQNLRPITASNVIVLVQRKPKVLLDLLAEVHGTAVDQARIRSRVLDKFVQMAELELAADVDAKVPPQACAVRLDADPGFDDVGRFKHLSQRWRHELVDCSSRAEDRKVKERNALFIRQLDQRDIVSDAARASGLGFPLNVKADYLA